MLFIFEFEVVSLPRYRPMSSHYFSTRLRLLKLEKVYESELTMPSKGKLPAHKTVPLLCQTSINPLA